MSDFRINFLGEYTDSSIAEELRRIASLLGKDTVSKRDIENHGKLSYSVVNKHFGSLRRALESADLKPQRYMNATETELLKILVELWETTLEREGRIPQRKDLKEYGFPVSGDTYARKFGSWKKALMKAYESVNPGQLDEEEIVVEALPNSKSKSHGYYHSASGFLSLSVMNSHVVCAVKMELGLNSKLIILSQWKKVVRMYWITFIHYVSSVIVEKEIPYKRPYNKREQYGPTGPDVASLRRCCER